MAIACFWGFPDFISARMLAEIVFFDEPFLRGINIAPVRAAWREGQGERQPSAQRSGCAGATSEGQSGRRWSECFPGVAQKQYRPRPPCLPIDAIGPKISHAERQIAARPITIDAPCLRAKPRTYSLGAQFCRGVVKIALTPAQQVLRGFGRPAT
jgi:hypothetical protein